MRTIRPFKANSTNAAPVESVSIYIDCELGETSNFTSRDLRALFKAQAQVIAEALSASLPGGTLDALAVELLDRLRSGLVVTK